VIRKRIHTDSQMDVVRGVAANAVTTLVLSIHQPPNALTKNKKIKIIGLKKPELNVVNDLTLNCYLSLR